MKRDGGRVLAFVWAMVVWIPLAWAQPVFKLEIQEQPLASALTTLADQTGIQIAFFSEVTEGKQSPALIGEYSLDQALDALLAGTDLVYQRLDDDGSVTIQRNMPQAPTGDSGGNESAEAPETGSAGSESATASVETTKRGGIEEIIVTGQKKEERLQDVPIAISAFGSEDLDAQKIEGGFDLLKAVPNVTFSKTNFTGYNFQIRGIGTQAISATTDPGVAVSFNNTTLIVNRLFEQEYLDIERVEVLRGPQGTLYGRNATAGVINVISAKPEMGVWGGELKMEVGNFGTQRVRGMLNAPMGDTLALRLAGAMTKRDGYGTNQYDGSDVDGRDLWTGRVTLGWEPTPRFRANILWERFEEDDTRVRSVKQLCHRDDGVTEVGGFDISDHPRRPELAAVMQQGCLPGSLYSDGAFDTPNADAIPFVTGAKDNGANVNRFTGHFGFSPDFRVGPVADTPCSWTWINNAMPIIKPCADIFANRTQSRHLRTLYSTIEPRYKAEADIFEASFDYDLSEDLVLSSQTVYVKDELYSTQDANRFETGSGIFNDMADACGTNPSGPSPGRPCNPGTYLGGIYNDFAPDGVFCDPQLGCSSSLIAQDISMATSRQFNQEIRLVSGYEGPLNFSMGFNYTRFETMNDYFVLTNLATALSMAPPFNGPIHTCTTEGKGCVYIDPNPLESINAEGHNYFRSANPYELSSAAAFGELYYQITPALKLTAGLRLTWDRKVFTPIPSQTLFSDYRELAQATDLVQEGDGPEACNRLFAFCGIVGNAPGGRGYPANPDIVQEWREPTGRIGFDWKLDTGFTDETMVYAFYTRGYKGGGANPPTIAPPAGIFIEAAQGAVAPRTFKPEYVNAFEIGTKNALLGGGLILNLGAFYYNYKDYQISKIIDRSAVNENVDAAIWGLELESIFAPTPELQFNAAIGFLKTRIADGEQSIDVMDRTQGGHQSFTTADGRTFDEWVVLKPNATQASNCIAPVELVRQAIEADVISQIMSHLFNLNRFCPGGNIAGMSFQQGGELGMPIPGTDQYFTPLTDAPNGGAGFFADLSGNELPNAPRFTVSLGGQYSFLLPAGWEGTTRVDWYWQDESYHRIYNTEYDRLQDWTNTNLSLWLDNKAIGLRLEAYVKNVFDETPITGAFLNSDDSGLTTNIFTLDPRLVGLSIRYSF